MTFSKQLSDTFLSINKNPSIPKWKRVPILVLSNWIFQGAAYMDRTERLLRILLEIFLITMILLGLLSILDFISAIVLSIILVHTVDWIINCQFFALTRKFGYTKVDSKRLYEFIEKIRGMASVKEGFISISGYGSLSRDELKGTSDLDIRVLRKSGIRNGISSWLFAMHLRMLAFSQKIPLDLYVFDSLESFEKKMNAKERPVIIYPDRQPWPTNHLLN